MRIYLDHHAATPLSEGARRAMDEARERGWANPASVHAAGRASRALLEKGRDRIAAAIGATPAEIVLTSGGTEACNLAVRGLARPGSHVITTAIEHPAIATSVEAIAGSRVTRLAVTHGRAPSIDEVSRAITDDTSLVALQWVNHETGTVLPVAEIAALCRTRGVVCVIDATQALGKIAIDVRAIGATAMAFASHKIGGPAGAGALWIARDAPELASLILGGAQERGRRAGSPDVVSIAGFGGACASIDERLAAMPAIAARRDRIARALEELGASINAGEGARVATCVSASVPGWRGSALVAALDLEGLEVASGAACSSGLDRPSPVIAAMHEDEPWRASSALRISLGPETSDAMIERAIDTLRRVIPRA
ncbi:cysteine desulfurase family protein [Sandaracinus amylolyticus]|uniref:cysteine desulfurase family protein n=1 Tax=Sandaracinus amylolyticus TaxID=927083 RepID=UPI001F422008|nr:cysteine desulfurase family protein [Sandaracinus amylolyticus]UJR80466.1 Aminotransferase class V-fold PLP-dependent enzyme [Sandaracinus amylolyticus]